MAPGHHSAAPRPERTPGKIGAMTDSAPTTADLSASPERPDSIGAERTAAASGPVSRFGEAADLLDRLDTRPFDQRRPSRPWWRLW